MSIGYADTYDTKKHWLASCPFCGSVRVQINDCAWGPGITADGDLAFKVVCTHCGASGPRYGRKKEGLSMKRAANAWNKRS